MRREIRFFIAGCLTAVFLFAFGGVHDAFGGESGGKSSGGDVLYIYTLGNKSSAELKYDEAAAVASIQGLVNKESVQLYVLSSGKSWYQYWLKTFSAC